MEKGKKWKKDKNEKVKNGNCQTWKMVKNGKVLNWKIF